jgi:hypothetical protein
MLHLVLERIPEQYDSLLWQVLRSAGAHGHLAAAQWVRQQGALWPATLVFEERRWTGSVLLWGRQQGCPAADDADLVISNDDSSSSTSNSSNSSSRSSSSDNRAYASYSESDYDSDYTSEDGEDSKPDRDDYYDD